MIKKIKLNYSNIKCYKISGGQVCYRKNGEAVPQYLINFKEKFKKYMDKNKNTRHKHYK